MRGAGASAFSSPPVSVGGKVLEFRILVTSTESARAPAGGFPPAGPIDGAERIEFVDVLRGFALFGVLVANLVWYECDMVLTPAAAAGLATGAVDWYVKALVVFFVDGKFITLFSFLFAVGFTIQLQRGSARGLDVSRLYARRLAILFAIGCIHMSLIWFGDILLMYSLMGALLLAVRRWRPGRSMLVVAALLIVLTRVTFDIVTTIGEPTPSPEVAAVKEVPPQSAALMAFRGGYASVVRQDLLIASHDLVGAGVIAFLLPQIFGRFLLGFYAGRRGWLRDVGAWAPMLRRALPWLFVVGTIGNGLGVVNEWHHQRGSLEHPAWLVARAVIELGIVSLSAFYAASIALLMQRDGTRRALVHLAPVGRMALTNYLTHSFVFLFVMTGVGLGLAGRFGASTCVAISVVLFALQIVSSAWWLRRYRFGPAEWLWRSLTYGKAQPMRISHTAGAPL